VEEVYRDANGNVTGMQVSDMNRYDGHTDENGNSLSETFSRRVIKL